MIVDRRLVPHIDWACVGALVALMAIGLSAIYSARYDLVRQAPGREFWTQLTAIGLGLGVFAACLVVDYRTLTQRSLILYGGLVVLLVYVMFFGVVRNGSRRWIDFGRVNFQPSEFARIILPLVLATYFAGVQKMGQSVRDLAVGAAFLVVPLALIYRQPDLGTSLAGTGRSWMSNSGSPVSRCST